MGKGEEEERTAKQKGGGTQGLGQGREGLSRGHLSSPADGEEKESGSMEEPLAKECDRKVLKSDGMEGLLGQTSTYDTLVWRRKSLCCLSDMMSQS